MDNKEQEKDISSLEFDKGKTRNDFKFLVQKLKKYKGDYYFVRKQVFTERDVNF